MHTLQRTPAISTLALTSVILAVLVMTLWIAAQIAYG